MGLMSVEEPSERTNEGPVEPVKGKPAEAAASKEGKPGDPSTLTPEEQMARYEESLKEDDWGHQPC